MVRLITVTHIYCCLFFLLLSLKYLMNALMQKLFYFCLKVWYKDISMIVWKVWQQKHEVAGNIASHSVDKSQCPLTLSFESSVCFQTMGTTHFILWIQSMASDHGVPLTLSYEFSLMATHIQGGLPSSLEYHWKFCHHTLIFVCLLGRVS